MYVKLVLKNARRSVKDYLIYIVTMTICVALFYSFLSIASSYYRPDIGSEYDFTLLSDGLKAAICHYIACAVFDTFCQSLYASAQAKRICSAVRHGYGTKKSLAGFSLPKPFSWEHSLL